MIGVSCRYVICFTALSPVYNSVVWNLLLPWSVSCSWVMSMFKMCYTYILPLDEAWFGSFDTTCCCFYAISMPKHYPKSSQTSSVFALKLLTTRLVVCDLNFTGVYKHQDTITSLFYLSKQYLIYLWNT